MNLKFFSVFLLLVILLSSQNSFAGKNDFHPPQTNAEKLLDKILTQSINDTNLLWYTLKSPEYDSTQDTGYSLLFTQGLLDSIAKKEAGLVKQTCGGIYTGEICGLDYRPVLCGQDWPDSYSYRTYKKSKNEVIIESSWWPGQSNTTATYKLIKQDNKWRLDGIACQYDKFNF